MSDTDLWPKDEYCYGWSPGRPGLGQLRFIIGPARTPWKAVGFRILPSVEMLRVIRNQGLPNPPGTQDVEQLVCRDPIDKRMDSESVWRNIKRWLSTCSEADPQHERCFRNCRMATSSVPSRLIDVMAGNDGQRTSLANVPCNRQARPYLTLSYCWGPNIDQSKLQLLRPNSLSAYQSEIPMSHFPPLFKDVIDVARKLNIRYVWIDAYCIIQGDEADFQCEAAQMGEIYSHSILNIAAGGARSANDRLMPIRNLSPVEPCKVSMDWRPLAAQQSRIALAEDHAGAPYGIGYIFDEKYIEGQVLMSPLNRRAWVMQEQQLSPRILHFGKHQVFYMCWMRGPKSQCCETFPRGVPSVPSVFPRGHSLAFLTTLTEDIREEHGIDMRVQWFQQMMEYSRCNITFESDRLTAVAGLATRFARMTGRNHTNYTAGLWHDTFPAALCWSFSRDGPRSYRLENALAPSWSWASVQGGHLWDACAFSQNLVRQGYEVIDYVRASGNGISVETELDSTQLPYGKLKSAAISFSGYVISGKHLVWIPNIAYRRLRGQQQNVVECLTDGAYLCMQCNFDDYRDFSRRNCFRWWKANFYSVDIDLIPILWYRNSKEQEKSFMQGLVVSREVGSSRYRRLGFFTTGGDPLLKRYYGTNLKIFRYMEAQANIVLV